MVSRFKKLTSYSFCYGIASGNHDTSWLILLVLYFEHLMQCHLCKSDSSFLLYFEPAIKYFFVHQNLHLLFA